MASYSEQYYTPPGLHPSEPNYIWLEAGSNLGITSDLPPSVNHQSTANHFVTQLKKAGIPWTTYQESISGMTCPEVDSNPYAVRHNPFAFFDDVTSSTRPPCTSVMRPLNELVTHLATNTLARYNFISPNLCGDMHSVCPPTNDSIKQGDDWLSQNLPVILNSAAYKSDGLVIIVWDEGENGSDGPIGLIVLSPSAKGHGYHNTIHYTHSSTLRTLQKIFGVGPFLGGAASATDLSDLFVAGGIPNADSGSASVPTVNVGVLPAQIAEGGNATFTISTATVNPVAQITVHYSLSGKAVLGMDYTVSGTVGQVDVPPGASSAVVTLHALSDAVKERAEKVIMTLGPGAGYKVTSMRSAKKATLLVTNVGP